MKQVARRHEVLAEVPGRGPLLKLEPELQRYFADRLARGSVHPSTGETAVEWQVDATLSDPQERRRVEDELRAGLERVGSIQQSIEENLRGARDESLMLRVSAELVRALGGRAADGTAHGMRVSELRLHQRTLEQAARGVRRAMSRGLYGRRDGRGVLLGWCLLSTIDEAPESIEVDLKAEDRLEVDDVDSHRLSWSLSMPGSRIELRFADASGGVVPGTTTDLHGYRMAGEWVVPSSLLAGREVRAVAEIDGREFESGQVLSFDEPPVQSGEDWFERHPESLAAQSPVAPVDPGHTHSVEPPQALDAEDNPGWAEEVVEPDAGSGIEPVVGSVDRDSALEPSDDPPVRDRGCWWQVLRWIFALLLLGLLSWLILFMLESCASSGDDLDVPASNPPVPMAESSSEFEQGDGEMAADADGVAVELDEESDLPTVEFRPTPPADDAGVEIEESS